MILNQVFCAMAEALSINQFDIHAYLILLNLLPIIVVKLCAYFADCVTDSAHYFEPEKVRPEIKFKRVRRRYRHYQRPRKRHFHRTVSLNNCQRELNLRPIRVSTGVATDTTSWWPRWFSTVSQGTSPLQHPPVRVCAMTSSSRLARPRLEARFDTDSFKIGVDNHASRCMANSPSFFENLRIITKSRNRVGGIQGGLAIRGEGTFVFDIEDDNGKVHMIRIPNSLYVPGLKMCLLSPQHWAQEARDDAPIPRGTRMENDAVGCKLMWHQLDFSKTILFDAATNTPVFRTAPSTRSYRAFAAAADVTNAYYQREFVRSTPGTRHGTHSTARPITPDSDFIAEENINLSVNEGDNTRNNNISSHIDNPSGDGTDNVTTTEPTRLPTHRRAGALTFDPSPNLEEDEEFDLAAGDPQAELMRWHYRLGHLPFAALKQLAQLGEIPRRLAKVTPPKCAGCIFGAMTKVPWRGREEKSKHTIFEARCPGECVSVDQMISTQVGFVAQMKGKLTTDRYRAATIFVDHYSRLRFVYPMRNLSSEETINAKLAFEQFARNHGVTIYHYHADNGRFADNAFKSACEVSHQRLTFCGVNAHFQNGIAERAIRDLQEVARKQLLHARHRWPAAVHLALWPYAVRNAAVLYNSLPVLEDGTSRLEKFSSVRVGAKMRTFHTFGCPVYALNNALASGNSIPKWSPRARLGLNLGPSWTHARNVTLVLNLTTGLVSPQYHVNYDDFFETTKLGQQPDIAVQSLWQQLSGLVRAEDQVSQQPTNKPTSSPHTTSENPNDLKSPHLEDDPRYCAETGEYFVWEGFTPDTPIRSQLETPPQQDMGMSSPTSETYDTPTHNNTNELPSPNISSRGRQRRVSKAMAESIAQKDFYGKSQMHYMAAQSRTEVEFSPDELHDQHLILQENMSHPIAFHTEMMGDIMYLNQALEQPDADEFVKAVVKEINGHVENKNWELIRRDQVPADAEVVPSVWAMRRKRNLTTGAITKYKARLNLHGGKQVFGVNYFDTYAPVITWFAVRLLFVFGIINGWSMRQVDFIMAYPQAPIEMDMYMELPMGINTTLGDSKDYVLKLLQNIYGQKQAGRVWNQYLVQKLLSIGFKQSLVDECVFYRGDIIFIVYVDDGIFMGRSDEQLTAVIEELKAINLNIEDQGHPADYVGVSVKKLRDGTYDFTQRALIDSIIEDAGLTDAKVKPVPAKVSVQLHAFKDEPPFEGNFNYRSIVGKLNYLAQTTRPDIMYATHQIAKYSADPRKPHGEAILYLVRYLKKTRDIGLRFKPDTTKGFECYCDADFSGNWNREFAHNDPSTAKSRSGWIVFYAGCPIIWASKLQTQVALSTTEAEYIAMSMALRDVLRIMYLTKEIKEQGFPVLCTEPYVYCKVFEDNSGALELARLPKLRPRTKHINTCHHHFREPVRHGKVKIFPVDTKDQIADALTKALPQNLFVRHRLRMCGQ